MRGEGFTRPAQFRAHLFRLVRVQTGKGRTHAFEGRIPRDGGVAGGDGLAGDGFRPQRAPAFQSEGLQVGLQRRVLSRKRALIRAEGGQAGCVRRLYEMERIAHTHPLVSKRPRGRVFGFAAPHLRRKEKGGWRPGLAPCRLVTAGVSASPQKAVSPRERFSALPMPGTAAA